MDVRKANTSTFAAALQAVVARGSRVRAAQFQLCAKVSRRGKREKKYRRTHTPRSSGRLRCLSYSRGFAWLYIFASAVCYSRKMQNSKRKWFAARVFTFCRKCAKYTRLFHSLYFFVVAAFLLFYPRASSSASCSVLRS
uniref:Uncharacterized protein n=1 Tax=Trichogramma kaykai TaxID=54128 RepID=A0ABD2VWY3_9HYME